MHLVLEASAQLFFKQAHQVMDQYHETQYFKIHHEVDEHMKKWVLPFARVNGREIPAVTRSPVARVEND